MRKASPARIPAANRGLSFTHWLIPEQEGPTTTGVLLVMEGIGLSRDEGVSPGCGDAVRSWEVAVMDGIDEVVDTGIESAGVEM
jgi:hypothetical protein